MIHVQLLKCSLLNIVDIIILILSSKVSISMKTIEIENKKIIGEKQQKSDLIKLDHLEYTRVGPNLNISNQ